jgi:hypothetical protein
LFNAIFVADNVMRMLKVVQTMCSACLLPTTDVRRKASRKRVDASHAECASRLIPARAARGKADRVTWDKNAAMELHWKADGDTPERSDADADVERIFRAVPDAACCRTASTPHLPARELHVLRAGAAYMSGHPRLGPGQRRDDDLTHKLSGHRQAQQTWYCGACQGVGTKTRSTS